MTTSLQAKSRVAHWKETLAISMYLFCVFCLPQLTVCLMVLMSLYSTLGLALALLYAAWIYLDGGTNEIGGRRSEWFRNCAWWHYHRDYFPVQLHKTADLPPDKNYLLALIPHGILSAGAFSSFGTDVSGFRDIFPGLVSYLSTLRIMFFLPGLRELITLSGLVSPSQRSVEWVLGSPGVGRASVLVVGGAAEAAHNQPGVYKTVLRHRKGFCRLALKHGTPLVPVVAFGEVDLYAQLAPSEGTWLYSLQQWVKNTTGILPVRFVGEGFLGLLPRRVPVHVVVGAPIVVEKKPDASREDVDRLLEEFIVSVAKLFESEKRKYLQDPDTPLQFV